MIRFDIIICSSFFKSLSWSYTEKSVKGVSVFLNYFSSKLWRQINVEIPCFAWSLPSLLDGNQELIGATYHQCKNFLKRFTDPIQWPNFLHRRLKIALWNSFCHAFFVLSKFLRDYCVWCVCRDKCVCKNSCIVLRVLGSPQSTVH